MNIADLLNVEPSYWRTGIKDKDGIAHYRCRYLCSKCKLVANDYITHGTASIECHRCGCGMKVRSAGSVIRHAFDKQGNWYYAGDYRVRR